MIRTVQALGAALLTFVVIAMCFVPILTASAQDKNEVYTATVIVSQAVVGSSSGRIRIRISSRTSTAEKTSLLDAFKKGPKDGMALLGTMSKGYINIEGKPGRKIEAVFSRERQDGTELIIIGEHMASTLEEWKGTNVEDYPVAVVHLKFAADGSPRSGEVFPAVKISVTSDGFVDAQTDSSNKISMIDIERN